MAERLSRPSSASERMLAGLLLAGTAALFVWGAQFLPALDALAFGYDWHNYWVMFQSGRPDYQAVDVFNPPWTLALLWPLAALPFKAGWALLAWLTLLAVLAATPTRAGRPDLALLFGLLLSFWSLRQIADGNLAALTILGVLCLRAAWPRQSPFWLAAGLLLVTSKPQEGALTALAVGGAVLTTWPARRWLAAAGWTALGALPPLGWWGGDWLARLWPAGRLNASMARSFNNISLAGLTGIGVPAWAVLALTVGVMAVTLWLWLRRPGAFTPERAGLFTAAGLLVSPYANTASLAVALAVSVLPVAQRWPRLGWPLLALGFAPYLTFQPNTAAAWPESWQTAYLGLIWLGAAGGLWRAEAEA